MGDRTVSKWAAGTSYGPILSQTDLYLLNTELELNPILEGKLENYQLQFHLVTGYTTTNARAPNGDNNVYGKDEPATLPRVSQLIVISRLSPWCTIIKRETGVTIGDVCSIIFKDYTEHDVSDAEFASLNGRMQEHVKRTAAANFQATQAPSTSTWGYYPQAGPDRIRRVDWLRERVYFEGLTKDDNYARSRLGFKAPNIYVMELTS